MHFQWVALKNISNEIENNVVFIKITAKKLLQVPLYKMSRYIKSWPVFLSKFHAYIMLGNLFNIFTNNTF